MTRSTPTKRSPLNLEVHRQSLDTQAADKLRDAVLRGIFQPGERLTEELIANSFGLSRGTIRASLRLLVHEGLIVQEPYRGYSVKSLSSVDAWELFTLRNVLEAFAARLLAENIDDQKRKRLEKAFGQIVNAVKSGDRIGAVEADFGLHQAIVDMTDHAALQAHYSLIAGQVRLYQTLVSQFLSIEDYENFHEPLISAICEGRPDEAERLASTHNTEDGEKLVAWLKEEENAKTA